jgi:hypothetical protein
MMEDLEQLKVLENGYRMKVGGWYCMVLRDSAWHCLDWMAGTTPACREGG